MGTTLLVAPRKRTVRGSADAAQPSADADPLEQIGVGSPPPLAQILVKVSDHTDCVAQPFGVLVGTDGIQVDVRELEPTCVRS